MSSVVCSLRNASLKHFQSLGSSFIGHPSKFVPNPIALGVKEWTIRHKEHWLITGRNGEGKSLLAKALARKCQILQLDREDPNFGLFEKESISVMGLAIDSENSLLERMQIIEERGSFNRFRLEDTRVQSFIRLVDYSLNRKQEASEDEISLRLSWFKALHLEEILNNYVFDLSTGQLRKILLTFNLARVFNSHKHVILVLDEVFDGIDAVSKEHITQVLKDLSLSVEKLTILVISHRAEGILMSKLMTNYGVVDQGGFHVMETFNLETLDHSLQEKNGCLLNKIIPSKTDIMRPMSLVLEVENWSLRNSFYKPISFSLHSGDSLSLSGPNGCGKTTLLSLISCQHNAGYNVENVLIEGISLKEYRRMNHSFPNFIFVSPRGQLVAFRSIRNSSPFLKANEYWKSEGVGLDALLQVFNLPPSFKEKQCIKMSQGEQRKTYLIYSMLKLLKQLKLTDTSNVFLFLDEPFHGLDPISRASFLAFVESLIDVKRLTLIVVTHNADEVPRNIAQKLHFHSVKEVKF